MFRSSFFNVPVSGITLTRKDTNQAAIALGFHLFPSRTGKLSPCAPMVLHRNAGE